MSDEKMDKETLLHMIQAARFRFDMLLTVFTNEQMTQPGVESDWSVKDIIAHITWSEREMVGVMKQRALVGSDLWGVSTDERNQAVYEENKDRPLPEVLQEAGQVFTELIEQLEGLSEEDVTELGRFAEMPEDLPFWRLLAGNSYIHYHEHAEAIGNWFDKINAET